MNNILQEIDATHRQVDPELRHQRLGRPARRPRPRPRVHRPRAVHHARPDLREPDLPGLLDRRKLLLRPRPTSAPTTCVTGKLAWIFHTIPHPGEFGYDTWPKDAWKYIGGANTWGEITVDDEARHRLLPHRLAPPTTSTAPIATATNLFGDCLLALDARTGKRLWHFQMRPPRSLGLRRLLARPAHHGQARRQAGRRRRAWPASRDSSTCSTA